MALLPGCEPHPPAATLTGALGALCQNPPPPPPPPPPPEDPPLKPDPLELRGDDDMVELTLLDSDARLLENRLALNPVALEPAYQVGDWV